jgi:hypothetical protein
MTGSSTVDEFTVGIATWARTATKPPNRDNDVVDITAPQRDRRRKLAMTGFPAADHEGRLPARA